MANELIIWNYLKNSGYNNFGIAGIMGNLYAESGLNPQNLQNSSEKKLGLTDSQYTTQVDNGTYTNFIRDGSGYGLAQWTYWSRKENLLNYAKSKSKSIGDLETQLGFLVKELASYKGIEENVKNATSIKQASDFIVLNFERPASITSETTRNTTLTKRANYGQSYYDKYANSVVSNQSPIDRLLANALAEEGYLEKKTNSQLDDKTANAGSNNWTKYARDLDAINFYNGKKNGYAWCDVFVDWNFVTVFGKSLALQLLCQPERSAGAGCYYSAQYYKAKGQFYHNPQRGDQIFFISGSDVCHTGLVYNVDSQYVYTIEGNTSSLPGVVANGGCVRSKKYALGSSNIYGYGRPNWNLVPYEPIPTPVEEEEEKMTQEQFNKMMDTYLAEAAKKGPYNWQTDALLWAQANGIFAGDEHGNLMPQKFLTRGEAAVVLQRMANLK